MTVVMAMMLSATGQTLLWLPGLHSFRACLIGVIAGTASGA